MSLENTSEVLSFLFVLHLLEELICRIHKVKLRKRCAEAVEIWVGVVQRGLIRTFTVGCWCNFFSCEITDEACGLKTSLRQQRQASQERSKTRSYYSSEKSRIYLARKQWQVVPRSVGWLKSK